MGKIGDLVDLLYSMHFNNFNIRLAPFLDNTTKLRLEGSFFTVNPPSEAEKSMMIYRIQQNFPGSVEIEPGAKEYTYLIRVKEY